MRLIDADKLNDEFQNHYEVRNPKQNATMDEVCMMLFRAPTVNAVPVVRCRECKLWLNSKLFPHNHYCIRSERVAYPDDFCSYGERKEGAD